MANADKPPFARRWAAVTGAALLAVAGSTLAAAPASAVVGPAAWSCSDGTNADNGDSGGKDVFASCASSGNRVSARFNALGEHFIVCDHYPNGHSTMARLTVEGSGTATYYSSGSGKCTDFNLSFAEGLAVSVEVCTSNAADALCSGRATGGIT